jgi:hypothetical protein
MTTTIDRATRARLNVLKGLHDHSVRALYYASKRQGITTDQLAEDPELTYNLDAVDAIAAYLEDHPSA